MTVRDLTRRHMDVVINNLNNNFNANVSVLNRGQLGFALDKPRMSLRGIALYPELHQKATVLMETLCKSHTLTDGNKRASVMAAEYLANINGATLVVPLKTARLAVDCAMDADDRMSEEMAARFKAHIARDELELAVMLEEQYAADWPIDQRSTPVSLRPPPLPHGDHCKPCGDRTKVPQVQPRRTLRPAVGVARRSPPPQGHMCYRSGFRAARALYTITGFINRPGSQPPWQARKHLGQCTVTMRSGGGSHLIR